jgi:hypothetical protein
MSQFIAYSMTADTKCEGWDEERKDMEREGVLLELAWKALVWQRKWRE